MMSREQALAAMHGRIRSIAISGELDPEVYRIIPATGGPALQNLSLMTQGNRLVCVGDTDVVVIATSLHHRRFKKALWRGPGRDLKVRSWFGRRQVTFRVPGRVLQRRVQIDGRDNCERFLHQLKRCRV